MAFLLWLDIFRTVGKAGPFYHTPSTCCIARLTRVMPARQQNPVKIGFPPAFTSLTIFVFRPMAAMAMTIRNLLKSFRGAVTAAGRENTVVTTDASTKKRTKYGKNFLRLKEGADGAAPMEDVSALSCPFVYETKSDSGICSIVVVVLDSQIVFRIWSRGKKALLCDRYLSDTFIDFTLKYPKMRFERWLVWQLLLKVCRKPDCSFVLTITPEESMRRSNLKFEPFPEPQEKRVKRLNLYLQGIKNGRWQYEIDCMRPIDVIHQELKSKIDENIRNA